MRPEQENPRCQGPRIGGRRMFVRPEQEYPVPLPVPTEAVLKVRSARAPG